MTQSPQEIKGIVVRLHGRTCHVECEGREYECSVRGRLKQGPKRSRSIAAVGDVVTATLDADGTGAISAVEPRRSELIRHVPQNPRITHVIAANVEQMFAVVTADKIEERLVPLDKLLAAGVMQNLKPLIVVNKCDLRPRSEMAALLEAYSAPGFPRIFTSAKTGEGLDELRTNLAGRLSVFVGASGVGKSSLLNKLQPGLDLRTQEVDRRGEGRHTTTNASLLRVADGRVVDTPGLRDFGLANFNLRELSLFYPDFAPFRELCKFADCTHRHEPKCAVRGAVEANKLDAGRYQRYLTILREAWNDDQRREY